MPIIFKLFMLATRRDASRMLPQAGIARAASIPTNSNPPIPRIARTVSRLFELPALLDMGAPDSVPMLGTVIVLPQAAQGPDCPAYCSATAVCFPQKGQAKLMGMANPE